MPWSKSKSNAQQPISGDLLLADFQTVFTSLVMTEMAKQEAERSESQVMRELSQFNTSGYLQPGTIASEASQHAITRGSLDAHVKKVQAQQLEQLSAIQLNEIIQQTNLLYRGRKVTITPFNRHDSPIESIWFDPQNGYYNGVVKRKKISGIIETIDLQQNRMILKPLRSMRVINPNLKQYIVYVIDPETLRPMLGCSLF